MLKGKLAPQLFWVFVPFLQFSDELFERFSRYQVDVDNDVLYGHYDHNVANLVPYVGVRNEFCEAKEAVGQK